MRRSQGPIEADKYIVFGSFPNLLPTEEAHRLISGFKQIMREPWVRLINTNGKNLGSYLAIAAMEASMNELETHENPQSKEVIFSTENDLCINYLPIQPEFCVGDKSYDELLSKYWDHRLSIEMDAILGIFIGGGEGSKKQFELCKKHNLPCIGLPWYGGTGKEVFDEVTESHESLLRFFSKLNRDTEENKQFSLKQMTEMAQTMKSNSANAGLLFKIYEAFTIIWSKWEYNF